MGGFESEKPIKQTTTTVEQKRKKDQKFTDKLWKKRYKEREKEEHTSEMSNSEQEKKIHKVSLEAELE